MKFFSFDLKWISKSVHMLFNKQINFNIFGMVGKVWKITIFCCKFAFKVWRKNEEKWWSIKQIFEYAFDNISLKTLRLNVCWL